MEHGQYNHIEIPADDQERAQRFYGEVFGWSFDPMPGMDDYALYRSGPGDLGGAIGRRGVSAPERIRQYITVASLDESLERVPGFGGSITEPKSEIPGFGWYAVVLDSEGNEIGMYEQLARDEQAVAAE